MNVFSIPTNLKVNLKRCFGQSLQSHKEVGRSVEENKVKGLHWSKISWHDSRAISVRHSLCFDIFIFFFPREINIVAPLSPFSNSNFHPPFPNTKPPHAEDKKKKKSLELTRL